ncbi:MAG: ABC transporter permease [Pseudomonadota bacterium]
MGRFLLRRAGYALLLCWLVVSLTFLLLELSPGDASLQFVGPDHPPEQAALLRAAWGLDQPAGFRYLRMLGHFAHGDLGESLTQARPVGRLLAEALPATLELSGLALLLGFGLGVLLGAWQASRAGRRPEAAVGLLLLLLCALPEFALGLLLVQRLSFAWPWLPASGIARWDHATLGATARLLDHLRHLALPCLTLVLPTAAWVARHQRASLIAVLQAPWVRTARSLGLSPARVLWAHALPPATLPILALAGVALPGLAGGAVVVETLFSWPGLGRLLVQAVLERDTPVIVACFLVTAGLVALGSTLADLGIAALDPRVRAGRSPRA